MIHPKEPTPTSRLETDGKRSPMSYPGHPAYELMKGKNDTEITADVKAMIGKRTPGDLFLWLVDCEAVFAATGDTFYRTQGDLAAVIKCSTKTISRNVGKLEHLIETTIRQMHPGTTDPRHVTWYRINWNGFLESMTAFYEWQNRLKSLEAANGGQSDIMSANKKNTSAGKRTMFQWRNPGTPHPKSGPRPPGPSDADYANIDRMQREESGRLKGFAEAGELMERIRSGKYSPEELAERIVRMKFCETPDVLKNWLAGIVPGMTGRDLYDLAEAMLTASQLDPLDIIRRYETITLKDRRPKAASSTFLRVGTTPIRLL